jgi:hypothetical protein
MGTCCLVSVRRMIDDDKMTSVWAYETLTCCREVERTNLGQGCIMMTITPTNDNGEPSPCRQNTLVL